MKAIIPLIFCLFNTPIFSATEWENYKIDTLTQQQTMTGWCTPHKASLLMEYIHLAKPQLCVEIGTFMGAATYPIAKALMYNKSGMLHTIDTWTYFPSGENLSEYNLFANFWKSANLNGDYVYLEFIAKHFKEGLRTYCHPIRINSLMAAKLFDHNSIDFLYLDGDITTDYAIEELLLYFPKVKSKGAIWLNRADLFAKGPLVEFLMENATYEKNWSYGIECVLFIKK